MENVGYSAHCDQCRTVQLQQGVPLEKVEDRTYEGETSRTLYTRAGQHVMGYGSHLPGSKVQNKASWMWDHISSRHGGQMSDKPSDDFTFQISLTVSFG